MPDLNPKNRILAIDGLRAIAAFGVVWIHTWSLYGNPAGYVFGFPFYNSIAIVGNGVDFFFVISGFCMYLVIDKKTNLKSYTHFIGKRIRRIVPAYFFCVLVYAIVLKISDPSFLFAKNVLFHFVFLNGVVIGNNIAGPFWSLATEWHFYLILPLLLLISRKIGLIITVGLFSILSILLFLLVLNQHSNVKWWSSLILIRFPEFAIGIVSSYLFLTGKRLPWLLNGAKGLIIGFLIMYSGRFFGYTAFWEQLGSLGIVARSISLPVMCCGFAIVLYNLITNSSFISRILSGRIMIYLGKLSFAVYLWHSLIIMFFMSFLKNIKLGSFTLFGAFLFISFCTIIVAHFSYKYLEAFYFKQRKRENDKMDSVTGNAINLVKENTVPAI